MQNPRGKVLIVDDEAAIRQMINLAVTQAGYACLEAADANEAQTRIVNDGPDVVLLDWMLPGISGIEYARRLRREKLTQHLPIIILTARTEEEDKVRGLDSGADDYITKPFSTRELLARINAIMRRHSPLTTDTPVEVQGLALDPITHRVSANGTNLLLGPTEFRLLHFFMTFPERVHSRERLLNGVWGDNVYVEERTVDVHIRRLRKALGPSAHDRLIQTVRGAGYRFSAQG
jgi:two-component system, OmpR family, phosphate regulon response regulator PhoB